MKSPITVGIMLLLILGVFGGVAITPVTADAVMTISEFQISTDPAEQSEPDIDDLHIVYQDNRNGNWDIYLYTLQGTFIPETRITTNTANQQFPAISGNRIVWQDNRNGNWDIYLYDIGTQTETQITTNTANQLFPAISGNRIVWQDDRNGDSDIYLYDINTQTETLLTRSCYPNPCPSKYPAIYGENILYQKTWAPSYSWVPCLFKVDPATKSETYLTVWVNNNNNPDIAIYENRVVWTTYEYIYDGYHTSIWMYDLNTGSMTRLTETWHVTYDEGHPDTHGTAPAYVVYYDNRNRYWGPNMQYFNNADVFVLNLDRQTETLVTNNTADQVNPAIYGGRIVYMDNRNGNWDIYMAMLGWSAADVPPVPIPNYTRPEVERWNVTRPEVTEWNITRPEVERWYVNRPEVTEWNVSRPEVERWNVNRPEVTEWNVSRPEVERWNVTRSEVERGNFTRPTYSGPSPYPIHITGVTPNEGTVGTEFTISGTGFGYLLGEILLGPNPCEVLAWNNSMIVCRIVEPLQMGEYNVTVLIRDQPLTFTGFTMREPLIIPADTPSGLLIDNETITIPGDFFGDQEGDVSIIAPGGETITAKVVDWSMKSIRFEIPKELDGTYGTYVIKVENGVGDTLRFVYVDSGMPGDMQDYAYIGDKSHKCAAGVAYKGKWYVFYSHPDCVFCTDSNRIKMKSIEGWNPISLSGSYSSIPDGTTDAAVVPIVIEDTMWVFCTGQDGKLHYWRYNVTDHDSKWNHISVSGVTTDHNWEIAPVYNNVTHRIEVYYEHDRTLNWVYSDNYGSTWNAGGDVPGVGTISTAPSAAFYQSLYWGTPYDILLAVGNETNQGKVYALKDGTVIGTVLSFGTVNGRPYIYDTGYWHDEFHLFWRQADNSDVYFKGMYRWNNDAWGPTEKYGCYSGDPTDWCWRSDWAVNAAASGASELQFWGYDGHWAMNTVGLPCPPYPHCKGICC